MDELNKEDWENIIELLDMGASYDNNGCSYAANEEKNEHDIKLMNSYRKLKAALA